MVVALGCAGAVPVAVASSGCADVAADENVGEDLDEASAAVESSSGFSPMTPCLSVADYVPRAVVRFGLGTTPYRSPCTRLATGGTVVFQGPFAAHPLVPSEETGPSPIQYTDSGGWAEFEFPDFGFFAYHCEVHPEEKGVVWASWAF